MDPLQQTIARKIQLQQRAAKRREAEENAKNESSSDDEDVQRPGSSKSGSPSSQKRGTVKKIMKKGDALMFYKGAHQSKAARKLSRQISGAAGAK